MNYVCPKCHKTLIRRWLFGEYIWFCDTQRGGCGRGYTKYMLKEKGGKK